MQSMLCTCRVSSAASLPIPAETTALLPAFLRSGDRRNRRRTLESNTTTCFLLSLEVLNSQVGNPFPGTLLPCHSADSLSHVGTETGRFQCTSLTIPHSPAKLRVWKLEGTFNPSSCCSCSFGASSQGGGAQSASPLLLQLHLRPRCPFHKPELQFSFKGASDTPKPQTQPPADTLSLGTSLCVIASLHWSKTNTDINLSVSVFH